MIILSGTFRMIGEDREEVLEGMRALVQATWDHDPGVLAYHFGVDLNDDRLVHVYEEWDSVENLKVHGKQPHMDLFRALRNAKKIETVRFNRSRAEDLGEF